MENEIYVIDAKLKKGNWKNLWKYWIY